MIQTQQMNELRVIRAHSILAKGVSPKPLNDETFLIPSQSGNGKYLIRNNGQNFVCECPDFKYRQLDCKHILALKFWLQIREKINQQNAFEIQQELSNRCPFCFSNDIIKKDKRKTKFAVKQRYYCKKCGKKFVNEPIKKIKGNAKIVSLVLDLYFKGISLRKIKDHLTQFYGLKVHHETIRRWITRFTKIMNDYLNKFEPQTSGIWLADEQVINSKGKWRWSWNLMDAETRFLLANQITKSRQIKDARSLFKKAKEITKEKPEFIVTDGLWSYDKGVSKEYYTHPHKRGHTTHIRIPSIRDKVNNNLIERFHGTFRERDKVMRGFKGNEQTIADGFRNYYNFVRPHQALNGRTPSEEADIDLQLGRNKWLNLLRQSLK